VPQSKQTISSGNTHTTGLSMFFSPRKWMASLRENSSAEFRERLLKFFAEAQRSDVPPSPTRSGFLDLSQMTLAEAAWCPPISPLF
jgi:hypothetical protein